jgi:RNA polymerase sigma-70 factor (ECF subfamily)
MDKTPASLLERLRQPNERQAWDRFVELYTPLIYFWACRMGLQAPDAADLVQDVFLTLLRKMPDFHYDPHKSFRAWLRTVTLNKWREQRRRPAEVDGLAHEPESPDHADAFAEAEYRRYLTARALELMREQFAPTTWKAFWACVVREQPVAEVARELGLTPNAVYVAKSRVLTYLRQELHGLLD